MQLKKNVAENPAYSATMRLSRRSIAQSSNNGNAGKRRLASIPTTNTNISASIALTIRKNWPPPCARSFLIAVIVTAIIATINAAPINE